MDWRSTVTTIGLFVLSYLAKRILDWLWSIGKVPAIKLLTWAFGPLARAKQREDETRKKVESSVELRTFFLTAATYHLVKVAVFGPFGMMALANAVSIYDKGIWNQPFSFLMSAGVAVTCLWGAFADYFRYEFCRAVTRPHHVRKLIQPVLNETRGS